MADFKVTELAEDLDFDALCDQKIAMIGEKITHAAANRPNSK